MSNPARDRRPRLMHDERWQVALSRTAARNRRRDLCTVRLRVGGHLVAALPDRSPPIRTAGTGKPLQQNCATIRLLSANEEARACFPAVHDAMCSTSSGEVARLEIWWDEMFADRDSLAGSGKFFACFEDSTGASMGT